MTKVAIATTDGINIDEHFGRAKEFLIYEVDEQGTYKLLEHRGNNPQCASEQEDHTTDTTSVLFADINVVLASKIGPGQTRILQEQGVVAFSLTGSIDKALKAYAKRRKLLEIIPSSLGGGCQPFRGQGSSGCSQRCRDNSES